MAATTPETEGKRDCGDNSCPELLSFKINSVYIDLDSADKNGERSRERFSMRGYVAKVQKKDEKNCLRFAWDNFKADETLAVLETSKSDPTPNFTNDINLRNDSNGIITAFLNIPLISTPTSMNSSLNDPPGEGMTLSQDRQAKGTRMPTTTTTLDEELKFVVECDSNKDVKELSDSHKFPDARPRDDEQKQEIVICDHPKVPCLVKNDYDYSQEKAKLQSANQSWPLLVDTQADAQSVGDHISNSSHIKKTRKIRTRLLSELLSSEDGNHVVAPTGLKIGPVARRDRNGRKNPLNDEEWRPYKMSGKNISTKKKISKRRSHNMDKTCSGIPDDVPMEIVELMAKNQYERSSKNTIQDTGFAFTSDCEKQLSPHRSLPHNFISTETDGKAACNSGFNFLFEIDKYAPYEEHTTAPSSPPAMVSTDQKKKTSRSNAGLHMKSKNGISFSTNYGTAGVDGYVNKEGYSSGYGFPYCTSGGDHSLDSYYSNHVVPAAHLLSLMNEGSSRLYGPLNSSTKQVCQFGFGAITEDCSSFSPRDKYSGVGTSDFRKAPRLFPPQPPPLYHPPRPPPPTQSKNGSIHNYDMQKTGVDKRMRRIRRKRKDVLSFPQNVLPKGHYTSPFLSHYDDPTLGCDSMKGLDLELGWSGGTSSDIGKKKMINNYYSNTEPCNVNRNPSDFRAPGGRNTRPG